ncbi:uncharacterized protein LOC122989025 [Thunnus albacares]|uniref:uncharacterized protein LOC122989025 n=1 Tax=Thunnus albacares TaxID=8236 RepID=UPI001CF6EF7D|nr:uncharacterized protein LOC122989025 [Thunnus albacares]
MDLELLLNASDEDSFEVPESPGVRSFRQPRLRSSVSLIPASRPSSSVDDGIVEPLIPSGSRGRSRTRRPKEATYSRRSLQPRSRSRSPPKRSSHRAQRSPRLRCTDRSSAPNMSEWTVARLKHFLSQNNIPFHRTDNKARLFQLYTNSLKDSTLSRPSSHDLPGSRRRARDDVHDVTARRSATRTPSSSATSASLVQSASNPMQALSAPQPFPPPTFSSAALTSHAYTFHQPSIPSSSSAPIPAAPSLPAIPAAPPPAPTTAAAQTAQTTAGPSSSTSYTQPVPPLPSFHHPCLLPYPPAPHDPHSSITCTTAPAPPYPTALHTASLGLFLAPTPPSSSYTLATAQPPVRPLASARPSPVSPTLRQQILTGNYIDLAQLIHPTSINPHIPRELLTLFGPSELKQPLPARSKDLTVAEFAFAFSLYRDIICSASPDRRSELDDYLSLILDLALRFGGNGFYTYHILFASQAAGRLQQFNQGTYWGTLDHELYCQVFAACASLHCETCGAPSHPAAACTLSAPLPRASVTDKQSPATPHYLPSVAPPPSITPKPALDHPSILGPLPKGTDRRGRPVLYQGGRMICNNFNDLSCSSSSCKFLHTCSFCGGAHARATCPHNPTKQQLCKHLNTPVNINALATALQNHPDTQFVNFLIQGFTYGFHPGLQAIPESTHICNNLQSALSEPTTVDRLLQKEVDDAFMIGPFSSPPFPSFRVSPIGVATRKYSGKKRLIIDLSSPHGSTVPSINSLIPSLDFSMQYATIDHAISLIRLAGQGAWLSKADITSAFKVLPIHPDYWHLFGVSWKGAYYFAVRLTFGCKSSPKIFDSLSEALCWILSNNYKLPYVIHLLEDFLTVTPPSSPPSYGLTTMISAFTDLGVPLSPEKTEGPSTSLEFLGITLNSITLQASLPTEKLHRISLLIQNFLMANTCTKRQLLSLLGHFNYATRIIPQGRSFLSHLLSIATAVPSIHDHVTLDSACKMELKMWHQFLSSWNGISFFYDVHVTDANDIQLYTDAAPSVGFGGYYGGRWFSAEWPPDFSSLAPSSTIAEMYPIVIAAILWGHEWSKKTIAIHSDNSAVVDILNKGRSHNLDIMQFVRKLTLVSAQHQFIIRALHIPGHKNAIADSLSRFMFQKFRLLAPASNPLPTPVPPFSATIYN